MMFLIVNTHFTYATVAPKSTSITKHNFAKDSPEFFVATVLLKARNRKYNALKPYFNWTWKSFYSHFKPEYPWQTISKAKSDADIYMYPAKKSKVHKSVYRLRYYALTEKGRKRNASLLIVKKGGSYQLAVQSNRSNTGDLYVQLGYKKAYVEKKFNTLSAAKENKNNSYTIYKLPNGSVFRCTFSTKENILVKIEQQLGNNWIDLYLVVFDLERTPTVKLKM